MKISKINEVYLELEVDEDVSRELCDYFTYAEEINLFLFGCETR